MQEPKRRMEFDKINIRDGDGSSENDFFVVILFRLIFVGSEPAGKRSEALDSDHASESLQ